MRSMSQVLDTLQRLKRRLEELEAFMERQNQRAERDPDVRNADCFQYRVATKSRAIAQRKLRGL